MREAGLLAVLCVLAARAQIKKENCGVLYECWDISNGATVAWRSMADLPGWVDIQLSRPDAGDYATPQFAAIGFSTDAQMGDDAVTECVFDGDHASVHLSYNEGHTNVRLPQDIADAQTRLVESRRSNGELYCRLQQQVTGIQDVKGVYDLNKEYQLLFAMGEATATNIKQHQFRSPFGKLVDITARQFPNAPEAGPVAAPVNGMGLPSPPQIDNTDLPPLPPIQPVIHTTNNSEPFETEPSGNTPPVPPPVPEPESQPEPHPEPEGEPEPVPEVDNNTIQRDQHGPHDGHSAHAEPEPEPEINHISPHSEPEPSAAESSAMTVAASMLTMLAMLAL